MACALKTTWPQVGRLFRDAFVGLWAEVNVEVKTEFARNMKHDRGCGRLYIERFLIVHFRFVLSSTWLVAKPTKHSVMAYISR